MVLLSMTNTVNMRVFGRTGEFGTPMALGPSGSDVFRLAMLETTVLDLIGTALSAAILPARRVIRIPVVGALRQKLQKENTKTGSISLANVGYFYTSTKNAAPAQFHRQ